MSPRENLERPKAEEDEERFDVLDEHGNEVGVTETRKQCHAQGIFHRAVYCLVVNKLKNGANCILLQQRSRDKKIAPLCWDLSVAEHLSAGEDYLSAAARGLEEELGIKAMALDLQGPIVPVHPRKLELPHLGVKDFEFVTTFVYQVDEVNLDSFNYNPAEVEALRWIDVASLREEMKSNPDKFTPWFLEEAPSSLQSVEGR